jgi:hypothetical protein
MPGALVAIIFLMIIGGCAGLPPISQPEPEACTRNLTACKEIFPRSGLELVHSMTARMPGGRTYKGISATILYPDESLVKCAIMSIEGLVFFSAESAGPGSIEVKRAVGPFENAEFATRVFEDIRRVFFPPRGRMILCGKTASGSQVCRYDLDKGGFVDIVRAKEESYEIFEYSPRGKKLQTVSMLWEKRPQKTPAVEIAIERHGFSGYRLFFELIEYTFLKK